MEQLKKHWFLILVGVCIVLIALLYILGFRLGSNFALVRAGTLVFENLPEGVEIYADQSHTGKVRGTQSTLTLSPGTHEIIVTAPDTQPWNELVTVEEGQTQTVRPLFIPLTVKEKLLEENRKAEGTAALAQQKVPTQQTPLVMADGCANVYVLGNRIIADAVKAETCTVPPYLTCAELSSENPTGACASTIIFEAGDPLRSVIAYPGRTDALVIASGKAVYVIELDPRSPRFFAPLAKGADIRVAPWSDTSILISHNTEARELPL